jgi:hypothetical protein
MDSPSPAVVTDWHSRRISAAELYEVAQRGDYCELVWLDGGKRQTKIAGMIQLVGHPKPFVILSTRGEVVYRLSAEDSGTILYRP